MLARDLGCTVAELGRRMSAEEFQEWRVIYRNEQLHPAVQRMRTAQLVAVTLQGPSTRRDKRAWSAADFMGADPWDEQTTPQRAPMTINRLKQFASGVNAARARR